MNKPKKLYFISDIHLGGDGVLLNKFEIKKEFKQFLRHLERKTEKNNLELIIVGDFLNLWDVQKRNGLEKFYYLEKTHLSIFKAFRRLSKKAKIVLIPGNHDHDLACFKKYPSLLKKWGIDLIQAESISRTLNNKKILIAHGNQFDPVNAINRFGDINDTPYGYHLCREFILKVANHAERHPQKKTWLADLPFFNYPFFIGPGWFISNYFYRELAPILRYLITPFLILFTASVLLLFFALSSYFGLIKIPNIFYLTSLLGPIKYVVNFIIFYNLILLILTIAFLFIWQIIKRDLKKSLKEYGINVDKELKNNLINLWFKKAENFLETTPDPDIFIFGHSHNAFLKKIDIKNKPKIVANTGTWIKSFHPIKSWASLPNVYYPHFCLSYLTIKPQSEKLNLQLKHWHKKATYNLTTLQKLSILFKNKEFKTPPNQKIIF